MQNIRLKHSGQKSESYGWNKAIEAAGKGDFLARSCDPVVLGQPTDWS